MVETVQIQKRGLLTFIEKLHPAGSQVWPQQRR